VSGIALHLSGVNLLWHRQDMLAAGLDLQWAIGLANHSFY